MVGIEIILDQGISLLMVMARVGGIFAISPLMSGNAVPLRVKTFMTLFFGLAAFAALPGDWRTPPDMTLAEVGVWAVREVMIGVAIGFIASLPITAAQLVGQVTGYQMGLALAQAFNPATDANSGVFEGLMFYVAVGVFVTMGGLEALLMIVLESFSSAPPAGMGVERLPMETVVAVLGSGFEMAIRGSAPVVGIIMIETVASAVLMRTIPQVNIMSVGFAIKIVLASIVLASAIAGVAALIHVEFESALELALGWVRSLGEGGGAGAGGRASAGGAV
ncbi:MAG: flagellar biosynthetic protein FliR [Planctomycetota bacterium]